MGHGDQEENIIPGANVSSCSEAMVEIKIKTLDSQTYTLRVDKCVPVPALKEQIASVTGVVSEQQRLICRGKVLKDDQLLSAYHVEDGHTLHLVVRQPIPPPSESLPDYPAAGPTASTGDSQGSQGSRVVMGSFDITEQGDGVFSDLSQVVSAVLGSLGIDMRSGIEGVDHRGTEHERPSQSGSSVTRDSTRQQLDRANVVNQNATLPAPTPPLVIPDSLTTLSQYLNQLRREFAASGNNSSNLQASGTSGAGEQEPDLTARQNGLPRPSHLAEVLRSMRELLIAEAAVCLSNLARQVEDHVNMTGPSSRMHHQLNILPSGVLLENLGAALLELGRTTMMLRLGQTPDDAVVNAGPAVFISPSGPNPIMVQPHPTRLGTSFGAVPVGNAQHSPQSGGSLGSGPRNIEIRIRTGSWVPSPGVNNREESGIEQSPGPTNSVASGVANSFPNIRGMSDSSRSPVAVVIPLLARYQQVPSGSPGNARGSQASSERSSGGLDAAEETMPESARQQQNTGFPRSEGDGNTGSESHSHRPFTEQLSRLNHLLRSTYHQEQINVGSLNSHSPMNTSPVSAETSEAAATAHETTAASNEGIFLSNVLQQIIPLISLNMATSSDGGPTERESRSRQGSARQDPNTNSGSSSGRSEPPESPSAKRQKTE